MSKPRIDPKAPATMLTGRITVDQAAWLDQAWKELGFTTRSAMLRQVIELAQRHEKELAEAS